MKKCLLLSLCLFADCAIAPAAVIVSPGRIEVEAALEGDGAILERPGETIDYLTFEVLTPATPVRLIAIGLNNSLFLAMGRVYGLRDEFEEAAAQYRIFDGGNQELGFLLDPGLFVVQIAVEEYRDGDLGPTFIPVANSDAIISLISYRFAVEGDVRGVEFLEGNRDRTFAVTQLVPEPSIAALLGMAMAGFGFTRRRRTEE